MRILALIALLLIAPPFAWSEPAEGPEAAIAAIYKIYQTTPQDKAPDIGKVYSARLQALLDADAKATPEGEVGKIDWDVFVDGQEWQIANLKITLVSKEGDSAEVSASFENLGEPREILFALVREGGRWQVDDVQSVRPGARWTMSKILQGDPDAFPDEAD
jgi:hypothetical protein